MGGGWWSTNSAYRNEGRKIVAAVKGFYVRQHFFGFIKACAGRKREKIETVGDMGCAEGDRAGGHLRGHCCRVLSEKKKALDVARKKKGVRTMFSLRP